MFGFRRNLLREFGNHIRRVLDHIGIFLHSRLHNGYQDMKTCREITGVHKELLESLVKRVQFGIADRDQNGVFDNKVDSFHLKIRFEEVAVGYDRVVRLDITGRHLNLLHLFIFLDLYLQKTLQGILRLVGHIKQVNPDDIFLVKLFKRGDSTCYLDFLLIFIEYLDFRHKAIYDLTIYDVQLIYDFTYCLFINFVSSMNSSTDSCSGLRVRNHSKRSSFVPCTLSLCTLSNARSEFLICFRR